MPRRTTTLARSLELSLAVPAVVAMRSAQMMTAGLAPSTADRREMTRMVSEKVGAFTESWYAMAASQQRAQVDAWMGVLRMCWTPWLATPLRSASPRAAQQRMQRAQAAVLASGLAPLHRVATANLRRLSRRTARR